MGRRELSARVSSASRLSKLEWLTARIEPGASVLLVGASPDSGLIGTANIVEAGLIAHGKAVALVYDDIDPAQDPTSMPCPWVRGSALDMPFEDDTFDYVVSNAVIEHVGGPAAAAVMVSESRRVARRAVFHTTPWRWSPVEVHTQLPLLHWLPRRTWQPVFRAAKRADWSVMDHTWLLGRRELRHMGATVHQPNVLTLIGEWEPTRHAVARQPADA